MPKSDDRFDPSTYAPVADRISFFYKEHPTGRIITHLASRSVAEVTFKAEVYRSSEDAAPAATGWASEREGDGSINEVACLENTETSAIGRALANLGFTASTKRPSAEEMAKVQRARTRMHRRSGSISEGRSDQHSSTRQAPTDLAIQDALSLIMRAERAGFPRLRAEVLRNDLAQVSPMRLERLVRRLRGWLASRRTPATGLMTMA